MQTRLQPPVTRSVRFRAYLQLSKLRIVALLVFTTLAAMVVAASGAAIPLQTLFATLVGGAFAASGASALNQFIERDLDARMARTKHRPVPSGRIAPTDALLFGLGLLAWSALLLGVLVNWLTAGLALFGAVYYVGFYTLLLKRRTPLNIVIGGGAGAAPVLVGWAAVTGQLSLEPFILFAIVLFWTPPHSWALALYINADYDNADIPMMPVACGAEATRVQIVWYAANLAILTIVPFALGMSGVFYLLGALALGGGLLWQCVQLLRRADAATAWQTYKYSSAYLALLFLSMILDIVLFAPA